MVMDCTDEIARWSRFLIKCPLRNEINRGPNGDGMKEKNGRENTDALGTRINNELLHRNEWAAKLYNETAVRG